MSRSLILPGLLCFVSCFHHPVKKAFGNDPLSLKNAQAFRFQIFNNDTLKSSVQGGGFGYDIYRNDTLYIHQPTIPAIVGNAGFTSIADANKVAGLMINKIQHNIFPPSVSMAELDSLGVIKK